jgi:hypothetical protein
VAGVHARRATQEGSRRKKHLVERHAGFIGGDSPRVAEQVGGCAAEGAHPGSEALVENDFGAV